MLTVLVPLLVGFLIYILFSPEAYITQLFSVITGIESPFKAAKMSDLPMLVRYARYYLCDALWMFSLTNVLLMIHDGKRTLACILAILLAVATEFLQLTPLVAGTFDFWDLVVEFSAGIIAGRLYKNQER